MSAQILVHVALLLLALGVVVWLSTVREQLDP